MQERPLQGHAAPKRAKHVDAPLYFTYLKIPRSLGRFPSMVCT